LLGVCGGVGELLDVDPTIVRVLWIIAALLGGAGVVAYLAMGVVVPVADR
jgi:phage shock protein C